MNINTSPDLIARSSAQVTPGYMSGFGNSFETEALPGALPMGERARRVRLAAGQGLHSGLQIGVGDAVSGTAR